MSEGRPTFDDAEAYELFMGRWSRTVAPIFLDWLAATRNARWLDVGCGTGAFTELILNTCSPASVIGIDPAPAQINHARSQPVAQRAEFRVADSQNLPFADGSFDVVASALVINFIPDRPKAIKEMRRAARPGGVIAGYVWDFAEGGETYAPMRRALADMGVDIPRTAGAEDSSLAALGALFERQGLIDIATRSIEVTRTFQTFDDFWRANTPRFHHVGQAIVSSLSDGQRASLIDTLRRSLPVKPDGSIICSARANAIKAQVPS